VSEIDLSRWVKIVWKWAWLIFLVSALAALASYKATQQTPPTYVTVATIIVGDQTSNPLVGQDDVAISQRAANADADLLRREPILTGAIKALGLDVNWWDLRNEILVTHVDGSQFIELRVENRDPVRARDIANELVNQLIAQSPTSESAQQIESQRKFAESQISQLQANISSTEADIAQKQATLSSATSARTVLDLQDAIQADQLKLTTWRATYAQLLSAYQTKKPANAVSILEPAFVPTAPSGPNLRANLMLAIAIGLLLSVTAVFVVEFLNDAIRDLDDVGRALGSPGPSPIVNAATGRRPKGGLVVLADAYSIAAEAYRVLRSSMRFEAGERGSLSYVVAGVSSDDGKSRTSSNLAVSVAQEGRQTILVDADLRNPSVHEVFGLEVLRGLTTPFVEGPASLRVGKQERRLDEKAQIREQLISCLQETKVPGLRVLTTGPILAANPADLLGSEKMDLILEVLKEEADVLILETPPLLPFADAATLAAKVTGVVLVLIESRTRGQMARLAIDALGRARARILAMVLDKRAKLAKDSIQSRLAGRAGILSARSAATLSSGPS
jgi:tyrosine-protein kinase